MRDNELDKAENIPPLDLNNAEPNSFPASCTKAPSPQRSPLQPLNENTPEIPRKKNAALIQLIGAPLIDLNEAKKQALYDQQSEDDLKEAKEMEEQYDLESPKPYSPTHDSEFLDAANEESFTLDSFDSLIQASRAAGKAFILARVTTVDPSNLTRLYYSFYAGHHINKVLFRTQPEEGLLHRMKSRNPLNNMLIVGDVHYFAITPEEFDRSWDAREAKIEQQKVLRTSTSSPLGKNEEYKPPQPLKRSKSGLSVDGRNNDSNASTVPPSLRDTTVTMPEISRIRRPLNLQYLDEANPSIPVVYEAEYFANDDDFLMRMDIRDYFRKNSVNPDDFQLFQLHRRSDLPYDLTVLGPDGQPLFRGTQPVETASRPRARNLWGLLDDTDHQSMVNGIRLGYLSPLGFWVIVVLLVTGALISSFMFLTASQYLYSVAGVIAIVIVLMVVFVNWEDNRRPSRRRGSTS